MAAMMRHALAGGEAAERLLSTEFRRISTQPSSQPKRLAITSGASYINRGAFYWLVVYDLTTCKD